MICQVRRALLTMQTVNPTSRLWPGGANLRKEAWLEVVFTVTILMVSLFVGMRKT